MRQQIIGSKHFLIKQYANSNIVNWKVLLYQG